MRHSRCLYRAVGPYNVAVPSDVSHARFYASTAYFFSNISLGVLGGHFVCKHLAHTRTLIQGNYFTTIMASVLGNTSEKQIEGEMPVCQF